MKLVCRFLACALVTIAVWESANAQYPVALVRQAEGEVRYRAAGTLNWNPLGLRKKLFVGDLLFTRDNGSARLEYTAAGAAVQLPPQTLFRVGEKPPTFTKLRRRFGVENPHSGKESSFSQSEKNATNPFERVEVRNTEKGKNNSNNIVTSRLTVLREKGKILLDMPKPNSTTLAQGFPAHLRIRVAPEFMGQNYWAFIWRESDKINPVWSGAAQGEFSAVPIPKAGRYEVQVMSDDETLVSDTVEVEFQTTGDQLSDMLKRLRDKRDADYTIIVE
jgi:hypothetical protein